MCRHTDDMGDADCLCMEFVGKPFAELSGAVLREELEVINETLTQAAWSRRFITSDQ